MVLFKWWILTNSFHFLKTSIFDYTTQTLKSAGIKKTLIVQKLLLWVWGNVNQTITFLDWASANEAPLTEFGGICEVFCIWREICSTDESDLCFPWTQLIGYGSRWLILERHSNIAIHCIKRHHYGQVMALDLLYITALFIDLNSTCNINPFLFWGRDHRTKFIVYICLSKRNHRLGVLPQCLYAYNGATDFATFLWRRGDISHTKRHNSGGHHNRWPLSSSRQKQWSHYALWKINQRRERDPGNVNFSAPRSFKTDKVHRQKTWPVRYISKTNSVSFFKDLDEFWNLQTPRIWYISNCKLLQMILVLTSANPFCIDLLYL